MSLDGAHLSRVEAAGTSVLHPAKGRKFVVGSYLDSDLVIPNAERIHCEIQCDAFGRVTIHNHSRTEPILLNGQTVNSKRPLLHGASISILDEVYTWNFPKVSECEHAIGADPGTPERLITMATEQAPNSCPGLKNHRNQIANRMTVHNFRYSINSDDEGNTSIESRDENSSQLEVSSSTNDVSGPERCVTPPNPGICVTLDEIPKAALLEATQNKENTSTPSNKHMLQLCARSDVVITSFSPRQTGVKIEKSFTCVMKPNTVITNTPKSVYSTPKSVLSELNDESCSRDLLDFSTPSTSKKALAAKRDSSMFLIDLTTPQKLRPTLSATTPKQTPASAVSCAESAISVDSTDESSEASPTIIDITNSSPIQRQPPKTPKQQIVAAASTPRRTPQSLMKRALLTSAKKQIILLNRSPAAAVGTPKNTAARQTLFGARAECLTTPTRQTSTARQSTAGLGHSRIPQTSPRKRQSVALSPRDTKLSRMRKSMAAMKQTSPISISKKLVIKARKSLNSLKATPLNGTPSILKRCPSSANRHTQRKAVNFTGNNSTTSEMSREIIIDDDECAILDTESATIRITPTVSAFANSDDENSTNELLQRLEQILERKSVAAAMEKSVSKEDSKQQEPKATSTETMKADVDRATEEADSSIDLDLSTDLSVELSEIEGNVLNLTTSSEEMLKDVQATSNADDKSTENPNAIDNAEKPNISKASVPTNKIETVEQCNNAIEKEAEAADTVTETAETIYENKLPVKEEMDNKICKQKEHSNDMSNAEENVVNSEETAEIVNTSASREESAQKHSESMQIVTADQQETDAAKQNDNEMTSSQATAERTKEATFLEADQTKESVETNKNVIVDIMENADEMGAIVNITQTAKSDNINDITGRIEKNNKTASPADVSGTETAVIEHSICEEVLLNDAETAASNLTTRHELESKPEDVVSQIRKSIMSRRASQTLCNEHTATNTPRRSARRASMEATSKMVESSKPKRRASCSTEAPTAALATPKRARRLTEDAPTPTRQSKRLLHTPMRAMKLDESVGDMGIIIEEPTTAEEKTKRAVAALSTQTKLEATVDEDYGTELATAAHTLDETDKIDYLGMREMLKTPKSCSTPHYKGLREMMRTPKVHVSPSFVNIEEISETSNDGATTPKSHKQSRLSVAHVQLTMDDGETLDKFLKTPRAKNIMIPNEPASGMLKTCTETVAAATVYDLNVTNATMQLDKIFDDVPAVDTTCVIDNEDSEVVLNAAEVSAKPDPLSISKDVCSTANDRESLCSVSSEMLVSMGHTSTTQKDPLTSTTYKTLGQANLTKQRENTASPTAVNEMSGIQLLDRSSDSIFSEPLMVSGVDSCDVTVDETKGTGRSYFDGTKHADFTEECSFASTVGLTEPLVVSDDEDDQLAKDTATTATNKNDLLSSSAETAEGKIDDTMEEHNQVTTVKQQLTNAGDISINSASKLRAEENFTASKQKLMLTDESADKTATANIEESTENVEFNESVNNIESVHQIANQADKFEAKNKDESLLDSYTINENAPPTSESVVESTSVEETGNQTDKSETLIQSKLANATNEKIDETNINKEDSIIPLQQQPTNAIAEQSSADNVIETAVTEECGVTSTSVIETALTEERVVQSEENVYTAKTDASSCNKVVDNDEPKTLNQPRDQEQSTVKQPCEVDDNEIKLSTADTSLAASDKQSMPSSTQQRLVEYKSKQLKTEQSTVAKTTNANERLGQELLTGILQHSVDESKNEYTTNVESMEGLSHADNEVPKFVEAVEIIEPAVNNEKPIDLVEQSIDESIIDSINQDNSVALDEQPTSTLNAENVVIELDEDIDQMEQAEQSIAESTKDINTTKQDDSVVLVDEQDEQPTSTLNAINELSKMDETGDKIESASEIDKPINEAEPSIYESKEINTTKQNDSIVLVEHESSISNANNEVTELDEVVEIIEPAIKKKEPIDNVIDESTKDVTTTHLYDSVVLVEGESAITNEVAILDKAEDEIAGAIGNEKATVIVEQSIDESINQDESVSPNEQPTSKNEVTKLDEVVEIIEAAIEYEKPIDKDYPSSDESTKDMNTTKQDDSIVVVEEQSSSSNAMNEVTKLGETVEKAEPAIEDVSKHKEEPIDLIEDFINESLKEINTTKQDISVVDETSLSIADNAVIKLDAAVEMSEPAMENEKPIGSAIDKSTKDVNITQQEDSFALVEEQSTTLNTNSEVILLDEDEDELEPAIEHKKPIDLVKESIEESIKQDESMALSEQPTSDLNAKNEVEEIIEAAIQHEKPIEKDYPSIDVSTKDMNTTMQDDSVVLVKEQSSSSNAKHEVTKLGEAVERAEPAIENAPKDQEEPIDLIEDSTDESTEEIITTKHDESDVVVKQEISFSNANNEVIQINETEKQSETAIENVPAVQEKAIDSAKDLIHETTNHDESVALDELSTSTSKAKHEVEHSNDETTKQVKSVVLVEDGTSLSDVDNEVTKLDKAVELAIENENITVQDKPIDLVGESANDVNTADSESMVDLDQKISRSNAEEEANIRVEAVDEIESMDQEKPIDAVEKSIDDTTNDDKNTTNQEVSLQERDQATLTYNADNEVPKSDEAVNKIGAAIENETNDRVKPIESVENDFDASTDDTTSQEVEKDTLSATPYYAENEATNPVDKIETANADDRLSPEQSVDSMKESFNKTTNQEEVDSTADAIDLDEVEDEKQLTTKQSINETTNDQKITNQEKTEPEDETIEDRVKSTNIHTLQSELESMKPTTKESDVFAEVELIESAAEVCVELNSPSEANKVDPTLEADKDKSEDVSCKASPMLLSPSKDVSEQSTSKTKIVDDQAKAAPFNAYQTSQDLTAQIQFREAALNKDSQDTTIDLTSDDELPAEEVKKTADTSKVAFENQHTERSELEMYSATAGQLGIATEASYVPEVSTTNICQPTENDASIDLTSDDELVAESPLRPTNKITEIVEVIDSSSSDATSDSKTSSKDIFVSSSTKSPENKTDSQEAMLSAENSSTPTETAALDLSMSDKESSKRIVEVTNLDAHAEGTPAKRARLEDTNLATLKPPLLVEEAHTDAVTPRRGGRKPSVDVKVAHSSRRGRKPTPTLDVIEEATTAAKTTLKETEEGIVFEEPTNVPAEEMKTDDQHVLQEEKIAAIVKPEAADPKKPTRRGRKASAQEEPEPELHKTSKRVARKASASAEMPESRAEAQDEVKQNRRGLKNSAELSEKANINVKVSRKSTDVIAAPVSEVAVGEATMTTALDLSMSEKERTPKRALHVDDVEEALTKRLRLSDTNDGITLQHSLLMPETPSDVVTSHRRGRKPSADIKANINRRGRKASNTVDAIDEPTTISINPIIDSKPTETEQAEPLPSTESFVEKTKLKMAETTKSVRRGRKHSGQEEQAIELPKTSKRMARKPSATIEIPAENLCVETQDEGKQKRRGRKASAEVAEIVPSKIESVEILAPIEEAAAKVKRRGRRQSVDVKIDAETKEQAESITKLATETQEALGAVEPQKQAEEPEEQMEHKTTRRGRKPSADVVVKKIPLIASDTEQKHKRRGRKASEELVDAATVSKAALVEPTEKEKPHTRRGRKATVEENKPDVAELITKASIALEKKPAKRGRKATADTEPAQQVALAVELPIPESLPPVELLPDKKPTRRGRKGSANTEPTVLVEEPAQSKKTTRKGRKPSPSMDEAAADRINTNIRANELDQQATLKSVAVVGRMQQQETSAAELLPVTPIRLCTASTDAPLSSPANTEDELTPRRREGRNVPRKNYDETSDDEKGTSGSRSNIRKTRKLASKATVKPVLVASEAAKTEESTTQVKQVAALEPATPEGKPVPLPEQTTSGRREGRNIPRRNYNETSDDEKPRSARPRGARNPTAKELKEAETAPVATPKQRKGKTVADEAPTADPQITPVVAVTAPVTTGRGRRKVAVAAEADEPQPNKRQAMRGNARKTPAPQVEDKSDEPVNKKARSARVKTPIVPGEDEHETVAVAATAESTSNLKLPARGRGRAPKVVVPDNVAPLALEPTTAPGRSGRGRKVHFEAAEEQQIASGGRTPEPPAKRATRSKRK